MNHSLKNAIELSQTILGVLFLQIRNIICTHIPFKKGRTIMA